MQSEGSAPSVQAVLAYLSEPVAGHLQVPTRSMERQGGKESGRKKATAPVPGWNHSKCCPGVSWHGQFSWGLLCSLLVDWVSPLLPSLHMSPPAFMSLISSSDVAGGTHGPKEFRCILSMKWGYKKDTEFILLSAELI